LASRDTILRRRKPVGGGEGDAEADKGLPDGQPNADEVRPDVEGGFVKVGNSEVRWLDELALNSLEVDGVVHLSLNDDTRANSSAQVRRFQQAGREAAVLLKEVESVKIVFTVEVSGTKGFCS
jgi:hypothetical protein